MTIEYTKIINQRYSVLSTANKTIMSMKSVFTTFCNTRVEQICIILFGSADRMSLKIIIINGAKP